MFFILTSDVRGHKSSKCVCPNKYFFANAAVNGVISQLQKPPVEYNLKSETKDRIPKENIHKSCTDCNRILSC